MKKTIEKLNQSVAEMTVFYQKMRHFHWHVKGEDFFVLHEKFEEIYNEVNEMIDELAERVVALGGTSMTSLKVVLSKAKKIKENNSFPTDKEMVKEVLKDLKTLVELSVEHIKQVEKTGDRTTVNMLDSAVDKLNHHVWMLEATMKK